MKRFILILLGIILSTTFFSQSNDSLQMRALEFASFWYKNYKKDVVKNNISETIPSDSIYNYIIKNATFWIENTVKQIKLDSVVKISELPFLLNEKVIYRTEVLLKSIMEEGIGDNSDEFDLQLLFTNFDNLILVFVNFENKKSTDLYLLLHSNKTIKVAGLVS